MARLWEYLERLDWTLLAAAFTLAAVGLVAIYGIGVSQEPADLFLFHKQFVTFSIGVSIIAAFVFLDYRHLRSYGLMLYIVGAVLLLGVLFFGVRINATQGWFRLGTLSFQPVEIAKVTLVIYLAAFFVRRGRGRLSWSTLGLSFVATCCYAGLILLQPDFGSAMIILFIWLGMVLVSGISKTHLLLVIISGILVFSLLWVFAFKPYQKARIYNFLNPLTDVQKTGYNVFQSTIAVGSGQIMGKGLGFGTQSRLKFLPVPQSDFVFAAFAEEWGFVGSSLILLLFGLVIWRILHTAYLGASNFEILFGMGIAIFFMGHILINVGMNLGIMPVTGIPLPFMSYGGSHLLAEFMGLGILMSMRRYARSAHRDDTKHEFLGI